MFNRVSKSFNAKNISSFSKLYNKEPSYKLNLNYTSKYSMSSLYKTQYNSFVGKLT